MHFIAPPNNFPCSLILVIDENDNSPEFVESTYIFEVEENTDFIEFQVSATDVDLGSNSAVTYSIVDGNVEQTFLIGKNHISVIE